MVTIQVLLKILIVLLFLYYTKYTNESIVLVLLHNAKPNVYIGPKAWSYCQGSIIHTSQTTHVAHTICTTSKKIQADSLKTVSK